MFDENIKQEYIDSLPTGLKRKTGQYILRIAPYEEEHKKSVWEMTKGEFKDLMDSLEIKSIAESVSTRRELSKYIDWCQKKFEITASNPAAAYDPIAEFTAKGFYSKYCTFDDAVSLLLSVYPATEGYIVFPLVCLAWIGLTPQDAIELQNGDVNIQKKTVSCGRKSFKIQSPKCLEILSTYKNTTTGIRTQNRTFSVTLVDIGQFLKRTKSANSKKEDRPVDLSHISKSFALFSDKYDSTYDSNLNVSYHDVWKLGAMNRLYDLDRESGWKIADLSPDSIVSCYGITHNGMTRPMILADYAMYKERREKRR